MRARAARRGGAPQLRQGGFGASFGVRRTCARDVGCRTWVAGLGCPDLRARTGWLYPALPVRRAGPRRPAPRRPYLSDRIRAAGHERPQREPRLCCRLGDLPVRPVTPDARRQLRGPPDARLRSERAANPNAPAHRPLATITRGRGRPGGGSSDGQSSGLIIRWTSVQVRPAPPPVVWALVTRRRRDQRSWGLTLPRRSSVLPGCLRLLAANPRPPLPRRRSSRRTGNPPFGLTRPRDQRRHLCCPAGRVGRCSLDPGVCGEGCVSPRAGRTCGPEDRRIDHIRGRCNGAPCPGNHECATRQPQLDVTLTAPKLGRRHGEAPAVPPGVPVLPGTFRAAQRGAGPQPIGDTSPRKAPAKSSKKAVNESNPSTSRTQRGRRSAGAPEPASPSPLSCGSSSS